MNGAVAARWPILRDARLFQIAFLATLLTIGVLVRDFALLPAQMALAFAAGIATQKLWIRALGIRHRGILSAVITCFGLSCCAPIRCGSIRSRRPSRSPRSS